MTLLLQGRPNFTRIIILKGRKLPKVRRDVTVDRVIAG